MIRNFWRHLQKSITLTIAVCTCNILGTVDNQGCDMKTGECKCKRYVTARDCNQCLPEYWGLSEEYDGCKPCDCDPGGSYENSCDVITGQCRCRPHISGRTCNQPQQSYYTGSLDFLIYEGELSRATDVSKLNFLSFYLNCVLSSSKHIKILDIARVTKSFHDMIDFFYINSNCESYSLIQIRWFGVRFSKKKI